MHVPGKTSDPWTAGLLPASCQHCHMQIATQVAQDVVAQEKTAAHEAVLRAAGTSCGPACGLQGAEVQNGHPGFGSVRNACLTAPPACSGAGCGPSLHA